MSLWTGTDHFFYDSSVDNRTEFGDVTNYLTFLSQNWIDIDASRIPGDVPALVEMSLTGVDPTGGSFYNVMVAKTTKPRTIKARSGLPVTGADVPAFAILNAGDCDGTSAVTIANDTCGVISDGSTTQKKIATYSLAAGPAANFTGDIILYLVNTAPYRYINLWRGTWSVFLRCKQTNGTQGDVYGRLQIRDGLKSEVSLDPIVMPTIATSVSCVREWAVQYLGTFRLPFDKNAFSSGKSGTGLSNDQAAIEFELQLRNTAAAIRTFEFLDFIFMPMDESFGEVIVIDPTLQMNAELVTLDNTGYLAHGQPGDFGSFDFNSNDINQAQEVRGSLPTLTPGVNNRLYFLYSIMTGTFTLGSQFSDPAGSLVTRLNIVPRWLGTRDV